MDTNVDLNKFYRIYGGIAWPGAKPGFLVILGRDKANAPGRDVPMIHELDEMESPDIWTLLEAAARYDNLYYPEKWLLSDIQNQAGMNLLKEMNNHLQTRLPYEMRQRKISATAAPFSESKDALNVWANCTKRNLEANRKLLQFIPGSSIPAYLLQLKNEDAFRAMPTDFPAIAALGMTLQSITNYRQIDVNKLEKYSKADFGEIYYHY